MLILRVKSMAKTKSGTKEAMLVWSAENEVHVAMNLAGMLLCENITMAFSDLYHRHERIHEFGYMKHLA